MNSIFGTIDDLYLFCKVVELGSLKRAALHLHLPQSTVSRRLSLLETQLGARLLEKRGRELVATDFGLVAYDELNTGMIAIENGVASLSQHSNQVVGRVTLSAPQNFYRAHLGPLIERYLKSYPQVQLDLQLNSNRVKPETDRDLLITFDIEDFDDLIARPLFTARHGFFVNDAYLREHTDDITIETLGALDWISLEKMVTFPVFKQGEYVKTVNFSPRLVVNDIRAVADAVQRGLGIASLPLHHRAEFNNLIHVLPDYHRSERQAYLVYKKRSHQPLAVKKLIESLLELKTDEIVTIF